MSAEATTMDLDARRRARSAEGTLRDADALLETTFAELSDALRAGGGGHRRRRLRRPRRDLPGHDPGPLGGRPRRRARRPGPQPRQAAAAGAGPLGLGGRRRSQRETHPQLVRVAAALELLHLFALIQDDVMDRSASRRGLPTLHVVAAERHREGRGLGDAALFGDSVATLVSDLALSEATMLVAADPAAGARRVAADGGRARRGPAARRHPHRRPPPRPADLPADRPVQERPLHDHPPAAARRARRRRRPRRSCAASSPGATSSATRSPCATTCSASGATRRAPASPPATTCARASRPCPAHLGRGSCCPTGPVRCSPPATPARLDDDGVDALQRAMVDAGVRDRAERAIADLVERAHRALDDLDVEPEADAALRDLADAVAWRSA